MQAAIIIMTIMGCDDAATACHYIATAERQWPTIALCETASEEQLARFSNTSNYPVLIAACQIPVSEETASSTPSETQREAKSEKQDDSVQAGMASKAIERARLLLPSADGVKDLATRPVHVVSDGYNWVVKAIRK